MGKSLVEQQIGVVQNAKRRGKGATLMSSDVARSDHERLQSLLLPFAAFLVLTTAIIHFSKGSSQPEPPQFTLLEETATEAISQRRDYAYGLIPCRATDPSGPKREEKRQGSHPHVE
jgi:hypothetical protein